MNSFSLPLWILFCCFIKKPVVLNNRFKTYVIIFHNRSLSVIPIYAISKNNYKVFYSFRQPKENISKWLLKILQKKFYADIFPLSPSLYDSCIHIVISESLIIWVKYCIESNVIYLKTPIRHSLSSLNQ